MATTIEFYHERNRRKARAGQVLLIKSDLGSDPGFWKQGRVVGSEAELPRLDEGEEEWIVFDVNDDGKWFEFLRDITCLVDVFLQFDDDNRLAKFKFLHNKKLGNSLMKLKSLRNQKEESQKKVIVLNVDTKLKKWQTINPRDTLAARLGCGKSFFWILKNLRLFLVVTPATTVLCYVCLGNIMFPFMRGENDDFVFKLNSVLMTTWLVINTLLSNHVILKEVLPNFLCWYLGFFSVLSMIGFVNAFHGDGRALFLCLAIAGLVLFVGSIDAAHPSVRRNYRAVAITLLAAVSALAFMVIWFYFFPDYLAEPVNKDPMFSWQLGHDPNNLTHIYGLTLALDCMLCIIFWILWVAIHMLRYPHESVFFCPDVRMEFMTPLQFVMYESRVTGDVAKAFDDHRVDILYASSLNLKSEIHASTLRQSCLFSKVGNSFILAFGNVQRMDTCPNTVDDPQSRTVERFWENVMGTSVHDTFVSVPKAESFLSSQSNEGGTTILNELPSNGTTKEEKPHHQLVTLEGPFVEKVFIVDSRDTLGKRVFGNTVASVYFKFCSKTRWLMYVIFAVTITSIINTLHMYNASFREQYPYLDWTFYATGILGTLVGLNSLFFLNWPLFLCLIHKFETYFQLYLALVTMALYIHLFGMPRGFAIIGGICVYIPTVAFRDAVHPSTKLTALGHFEAAMNLLICGSLTCALLLFPHTLAEPLHKSALLNLGFGDSQIEVNIYSMAVPKCVLILIWLALNTTESILKPGKLHSIKAKLHFSRDYMDYQTKKTQVDHSRQAKRLRFVTEVHPISAISE